MLHNHLPRIITHQNHAKYDSLYSTPIKGKTLVLIGTGSIGRAVAKHAQANADDMKVEYPMESGDLHIFDNQRVLHGRTGVDPGQGERHLQQCSVNRDEFHNTLRTLAARLDHPAQMETMSGGAIG